VNESFWVEIDTLKVGILRNPYERVIHLYKESWDWVGLEEWIEKTTITSQLELSKECDVVVCLESWEDDFKSLGITPDKNSMNKLCKHYSEDYRRWYGQNLKTLVRPIVVQDLTTFGYRF